MQYSLEIAELHGSIGGCLHCNSCHYGNWPENHEICPIYSPDHTFTHSAGGLMFLAKALIRNQMEYSQHLAELVYSCSACRGCDDQCNMMRSTNPLMPLSDIIRLLKYEMVKRDLVPERLKSTRKKIREEGDLLNKGEQSRPQVPPAIMDEQADTVLYAECFHGGGQWNVFVSALNLLEKMEYPIALHAEGGCCGSTLFDHGFWDELPGLVQQKAQRLGSYADKRLLFVNPHCQEFTTNHYGVIADDYQPPTGLHISELLAEALKEGRLKERDGAGVKVAYHDPCMLARGLGITEPPREVLSSFAAVELVELERNRQNTFCCGSRAAGEYFSGFRERTARERLDEFEESGADILITACHYCKTLFQQVLGENRDRVKDLCEFVDERTQ